MHKTKLTSLFKQLVKFLLQDPECHDCKIMDSGQLHCFDFDHIMMAWLVVLVFNSYYRPMVICLTLDSIIQ